jgi:GNAT superfamily N-acetyltransferase
VAASQQYTTKELSTKTWPDFEQLFSQGGGWDFCGCMLYQRGCRPAGKQYRSRAAAHDRNLQDKRQLVEQDRAHGILVYMSGEAVGWCQYGRTSELPVVRTKQIRERMFAKDPTSQWRITCFVTRKDHRRKGVASIALAAAVDSIREQGGGWVEATPIAASHYDSRYHKIVNTYGRDSEQLRQFLQTWPTRNVHGIGLVPAKRGSFGGVSNSGTVSMFERQEFEAVKIVRDAYVLMRRHV